MVNPNYAKASNLTLWMRKYGITISFWFYLLTFWTIYNNLIVTEPSPNPRPNIQIHTLADIFDFLISWIRWIFWAIFREAGLQHFSRENLENFGFWPTVWLFLVRLQAILFLKLTWSRARHYLGSNPPQPEPEDQEKNNENRPRAHCICVRIVTRGDMEARELIRCAVNEAISLFSSMCNCEHLKAHVVTQNSFLDHSTKQHWLELGATEVKEFLVPPNYETPHKSLFKARNLCYWQDQNGVGKECREKDSWILSLDEEAQITQQQVRSFIDEILVRSHEPNIGYAMGSAIIDVRSFPITLINQCFEALFAAQQYCFMRELIQVDRGSETFQFHGGAYFVRANVDREMTNDWGPIVSVADDYAIGLKLVDKGIGIRYLDGWFLEGTAPTLLGWMNHRARVLKGQIYTTYLVPISQSQRIAQAWRLLILCQFPFIYLIFGLCFPFFSPFPFLPAGPRVVLLDILPILGFAIETLSHTFGAWYSMWDKEAMICTLVAPFLVFLISPVVYAIIILKACKHMFEDWKRGGTTYQVTPKVAMVGKNN